MLFLQTIYTLIVLLLLLVAEVAEGTEIDADTFRSKVLTSDEVYIVKFYSAMCGSCQVCNHPDMLSMRWRIIM